jgi:hypothetical protein
MTGNLINDKAESSLDSTIEARFEVLWARVQWLDLEGLEEQQIVYGLPWERIDAAHVVSTNE